MITILISVYTAQEGVWSITAVIASCFAVAQCIAMSAVLLVYHFWLLYITKSEGSFEILNKS